jgi:SAM-dependent methyltransferase
MNENGRSLDRLRHHFEVERELAQRLRNSTREQRAELYKTLYDELFKRVPDHPRLTRRETPESVQKAITARMNLLRPLLQNVETFLEFAPGDCRLAFEVAKYVKQVYGVDISDQSGSEKKPQNFTLLVYDGYNLNIPENSIDLAFSYQFLEHLHPDDVELHLQTAFRILKPGAGYLISTPHAFSGPHDISRYFSDTPQGFHLKEWTYRELVTLAKKVGFSGVFAYRFGKPQECLVINKANLWLESVMSVFPKKFRRLICKRLFNSVIVLLRK